MVSKTLSSTEAVRNFGEVLSAVKHGGAEIVITRGGAPIARVVPCHPRTMTLREFADLWESQRSGEDSFAADLEKVQQADSPVQL